MFHTCRIFKYITTSVNYGKLNFWKDIENSDVFIKPSTNTKTKKKTVLAKIKKRNDKIK